MPAQDSTPAFIRAAETKGKDNVRVAVAVLTEAESREYFGRALEPGGVQAGTTKKSRQKGQHGGETDLLRLTHNRHRLLNL